VKKRRERSRKGLEEGSTIARILKSGERRERRGKERKEKRRWDLKICYKEPKY